jgi:hypothetical protein
VGTAQRRDQGAPAPTPLAAARPRSGGSAQSAIGLADRTRAAEWRRSGHARPTRGWLLTPALTSESPGVEVSSTGYSTNGTLRLSRRQSGASRRRDGRLRPRSPTRSSESEVPSTVVGWLPARRALLVVEVKTMLASIEATHRRHDEKVRLAAAIARKRFGWSASTVSRLLGLPDDSSSRRHVARHRGTFDSLLPHRGQEVRNWLRDPAGGLRGIWFLSPTHEAGARTGGVAPCRIRTRPDRETRG